MRKTILFYVAAAILLYWLGAAQAQDQVSAPPKESAELEQKASAPEGETAVQPKEAGAQVEKASPQVSAPAAAPATTQAEAPSTAPFIGNKGSKKVHRASCQYGAKTSPGKRVYFNTYEEAVKAGYIPCKTCKPDLAAAGAGAAKTTAPGAAEGEFWASAKGKSFHRASCEWAKKISAGNLVKYKTRDEAIAAGKKPCASCTP